MPSIRVDKQIFPFFDSVKTPITSSGTSESFHNNGFASMMLEVTGEATGVVQGCVNIVNPDGSTKTDEECSWQILGLINVKNFDLTEGFSAAGQYSFTISGMARVRIVLSSVSAGATLVGVAEV